METDRQVLTELKQLAQLVHQVINDNQAIKRTCGEIKLENEKLIRENGALKRRLAKISDKLELEEDDEEGNSAQLRPIQILGREIPGVSKQVDEAGQRIIELTQQNSILLEENRELKRRLNLDPNARVPPIPTPRRNRISFWQRVKSFFGVTPTPT